MKMSEHYWYDAVAKRILDTNADVLFIIDQLGFSDFSEVRSAISRRYPYIVRYENEIRLRIQIKKKEKPIIILFNSEKDIPYTMLSTYVVVTLDSDIIFPLLDKNVISNVPLEHYQAIYDFYRDKIHGRKYERLSKKDTEIFIDNNISPNNVKRSTRILKLEKEIERLLDLQITGIKEWIQVSGKIAEMLGELLYLLDTEKNSYSFDDQRSRIMRRFRDEIVNYYDDTAYGPDLPVQWNTIERIHRNGGEKKAIICFDCMGFEEWNVLKDYLCSHYDFIFDVGHSLAIIPTETNFSRTTIFSGQPPKKVIESGLVNRMDSRYEEKLFRHALHKYGISENDIFYQRVASPNELDVNFDSLNDFQWLGIVFTFIDTLSHNDLTSGGKLIRDVKEFLDKSNMHLFTRKLLDQDFRVYFVSDHGSIFAKGNGVRVSRDLVNEKARRYMIFEHKELAKEYETENTVLLRFKNVIGDKWLLLESGTEMFDNLGQESMTHGGISIEEVVIPFVRVMKK